MGEANLDLIICSPFPDSADFFTIKGYSKSVTTGKVFFHSPKHEKVQKKRNDLIKVLGDQCPEIHCFEHPGPPNDTAWSQAWLLSQLQALEYADAIVAIGGKVSKTANTLLHLAEGKGIAIIPFTFLGGAAELFFKRHKWDSLHPTLNTNYLKEEKGIIEVIQLINQIKIDRISKINQNLAKPNSFFISRSNFDSYFGDKLKLFLERRGYNVFLGDEVVNSSQMALITIESTIISCDVCIILWSKNFALSPWCYDELKLAINLQNSGELRIWFFNIDNSLVVPSRARELDIYTIADINSACNLIDEFLK